MTMRLFNTLTRSLEELKPLHDNEVSLYQCGPTVYWTQHIGNMRASVVTDVLVRTLKYFDYTVKYARNYTDVGHLTSDGDEGEDKMIKGSIREGLTPDEIAQKYIDIFENDVRELNVLTPDFKPRATSYIAEMIEFVQILIDKDFAYVTPLAVYFDVSRAKDYTRLSGQVLENNIDEAGHGTVSDPNKKSSADFAVWFFKAGSHANALQTWTNPFSDKEGFPGWHIECSAMIKKLLGETIDIHVGGIEHIPVHHTNEIAQSESVNDASLAHIWMHYEHLLVNNKKMAKSEGTSYSLADLKEKGFNPLALRYLFLTSHYKSKQNFTWEALEGAQTAYNRLQGYMSGEAGVVNESYKKRFVDLITNDLDTPRALALAWEVAKDATISDNDRTTTLLDFDKVFGLELGIAKKEIVPTEVEALKKLRTEARTSKNWPESDRLRDEINTLGWEILDTSEGQELRKKN